MSRFIKSSILFGILAVVVSSGTGCTGITMGPNLGILGFPMPVSPLLQKKMEDRFWERERYDRVEILGPIVAGGPTTALDEPSDDEVMRAMAKARPLEGNVPFLYEQQRNNVRIVKEKIADYIDPPRFIPLIGPAQLHHAHYKCTIYFEEVTNVGWPIPHRLIDEDAVEVIYICLLYTSPSPRD